jgi:pimeloyl-ACP methyl ester carboxylesterase
MLTAETVHPEGARYAAAVVCIPGLWAAGGVWRGFASYLAHRGWECHLLGVREIPGGIEARAGAVADYVAELPVPAILLGHDAGALVALAAAQRRRPAAIVALAPLAPGSRGARLLVRAPGSLLALVLGRPVPPPAGAAAAPWLDLVEPLAGGVRVALAPEDAASVRDVAWGRFRPPPAAGIPAVLVGGARDRILPPADAEALARRLGAEPHVLEGAGHWSLAGPTWQAAVALVHRWLVQRLGEPLLELYAEAVAEREAEDDGGE